MITAEIQQMEIRIASNLIELEDRIKDVLNKPDVREGVRIVSAMLIGLALATFARYAFATDGTEFAQGSHPPRRSPRRRRQRPWSIRPIRIWIRGWPH